MGNRHRHIGKCSQCIDLFGSSTICYFPQAIAIALGGVDGGFDDIGHYFTTYVRYQWCVWFHNTKEYLNFFSGGVQTDENSILLDKVVDGMLIGNEAAGLAYRKY